MTTEILDDIKKMLGVPETKAFDDELVLHINGSFIDLMQIGVGDESGFVANKESTWDEFTDRADLESVKNFIYIKTRLVFDPPTNSFLVDALNKQLEKYEWRLCQQANNVKE